MIPFKFFVANKTAFKTWLILMIAMLLILFMSLFINSLYFMRSHAFFDERKAQLNLIRTLLIAKALPPQELKKELWLLERDYLRIFLSNKPPNNSLIITEKDYKNLGKWIEEHHLKKLIVSVALPQNQWLVVQVHHQKHSWFFIIGMWVSDLLLLFFLIFICWWAVRNLTLPTMDFIAAAKNFGIDIQSPPMALNGPPEIQEITRALNEMQARSRKILHDRTQILAAISHDLRTPITRLQLRAESLKDTPQYEKILSDLNDMEKMITSILSFAQDYTRSETMERFDINALLQSICDDIKDSGGLINYSGPENRIAFWGRLLSIKRALNNLIENAIKYGEQAEVSLRQENEIASIKISDQGPGIPNEEFENVFTPFYRINRARSPEKSGSGLGLTVARDIIRAHGGDITLHNRDSGGLTVHITLPLL